jgi:hypothetical protein
MTYKSLSLQELKNLYSDRPGFIFLSNQPSSREGSEKLYTQIKNVGVCTYEPDFINVLENNKFYAFIYPEGVPFKSAVFYEFAQQAAMMTMGMYKVDILAAFLKEN